MRISVASGKGGTGKTTLSLALAEAGGAETILVDCDVEEPNCHLFIPANITDTQTVNVLIPKFEADSCTGCGACVKVCRFHALARLGKKILVFSELCHSCGGCVIACPSNALREIPHPIGAIEFRDDNRFKLISGVMNVGHSMSPPLIRQLRQQTEGHKLVIFDSPPGTACPMVTTVRDSDFVILVTEPTNFGLHDLSLAIKTLRVLNLPFGVIVNRASNDDSIIEDYCTQERVEVLLKIPFSRAIAEGYSQGKTLLESAPELRLELQNLLARIASLI